MKNSINVFPDQIKSQARALLKASKTLWLTAPDVFTVNASLRKEHNKMQDGL